MNLLRSFLKAKKTPLVLFHGKKEWILLTNPDHIFRQESSGENTHNEVPQAESFSALVQHHAGRAETSLQAGFFGYDFERKRPSDWAIPRAEWIFFQNQERCSSFSVPAALSEEFRVGPWKSVFPEARWHQGFRKLHQYIQEGELYQANLSRLFRADFSGNSRALFVTLSKKIRASRAVFFQGKEYEILSFSPESFVDFSGLQMWARPIKGTMARGKTPKEDKERQKALLRSPKEAAELLMITDLLRNDLSQHALSGSVQVKKARVLQKNPNVFHTFSLIEGQRKPEISPLTFLLDMLPAGSISGCPKKRAEEIIEEIEPHHRGIFCGIFGFFESANQGGSSVLIRTFLRFGNSLFFQAGGGITYDSHESTEAEEIRKKAEYFFEKSSRSRACCFDEERAVEKNEF